MAHNPDDLDGSSQAGHHTLGPRREQATPGNHRHIVGTPEDGYISETLFDPDTDIINGSYSGTAFRQLLELLEKYGLVNDSTEIVGSGNWKWTDSTSGDPGSKYVGDNATLSPDATQVRISKESNDGRVITGASLVSGNLFMILGAAASGGYEIVAAVDMGTWFDVEANYIRGSGNFVDQELVTVALYPGASGHDHDEYLTNDEVLGGTAITTVPNVDGTVTIINDEPGTKDHGALTGLSDNDHPQYALVDHDHPVDEGALWTYKTTHTITDPGSGLFHTNLADLTLTTSLAISVLTEGGTDVTRILEQILPDDLITMQDQNNSALWVRYKVVTAVDQGGWFEFTVTYQGGGTTTFTNNAAIFIDFHYNAGGGGGTGEQETFYQPEPPVDPAVADVWMDSDGISAYPQTHPVPTGAVFFFASGTLPNGYIICDGRAVSRSAYPALFVVCGTTFGSGDGSTTFNVPNLINKYAKGSTTGGSTGGNNSHTHPGTNWRTGFTSVGNTESTNSAPNGTGSSDAAPNGTGDSGNHDHGTSSAGDHSHSISSASHNHGGTGTESGTVGTSGGGTGVTKSHAHSISSASHNHGGTGTNGSHGHGRTGTTGSHSHGVPGSSHSHTVPNSSHNHTIADRNHDHNVPDSTNQNHEPPFLTLVPMIYTGI